MKAMNPYLPMVLSFMALSLSIILFFHRPPTLVTFNEEVVRGKLIQQLAKHRASDSQVVTVSTHLKKQLSHVLSEYAVMHRVMIVDSRFVLAGQYDITAEIMSLLSQGSP